MIIICTYKVKGWPSPGILYNIFLHLNNILPFLPITSSTTIITTMVCGWHAPNFWHHCNENWYAIESHEWLIYKHKINIITRTENPHFELDYVENANTLTFNIYGKPSTKETTIHSSCYYPTTQTNGIILICNPFLGPTFIYCGL